MYSESFPLTIIELILLQPVVDAMTAFHLLPAIIPGHYATAALSNTLHRR